MEERRQQFIGRVRGESRNHINKLLVFHDVDKYFLTAGDNLNP